MNQQHLITPAQPSHTGQTGIPHRSDRSGLCATQIQKSGVTGRIAGVSGPIPGMFKSPPNPEYPDKWPDNPGPTGQTGTPDRSDRSYPDQT